MTQICLTRFKPSQFAELLKHNLQAMTAMERIHPEAGSVARGSRPEILSVLTSETKKNRKEQEKQ
jgi:hypothetical protein